MDRVWRRRPSEWFFRGRHAVLMIFDSFGATADYAWANIMIAVFIMVSPEQRMALDTADTLLTVDQHPVRVPVPLPIIDTRAELPVVPGEPDDEDQSVRSTLDPGSVCVPRGETKRQKLTMNHQQITPPLSSSLISSSADPQRASQAPSACSQATHGKSPSPPHRLSSFKKLTYTPF